MTESNGVDFGGRVSTVARPPTPQSFRRGFRLDVFAARRQGSPSLPIRSFAIEWTILAVIVFTFCTPFLSFDDTRALPGNESEVFQSLDLTLVNGLKQFGQFPLWNPYIRSGFPYIADPFLHVYNPLVTAPVLVFGVWDGFKVALFLSFLVAALGMWWLGVVLGLSGPARIWMGLMYAFTGQAVARFFQGSYDFVIGFGWIPWVLAFLLLAVRTRQRLHVIGAVIALACLFFSGNIYYTFYMAFAVALFALVWVVGIDWGARKVRLHGRVLIILAVIGLLALGLTAIQWLPTLDYWKSYVKAADTQLVGSHSLRQIWLDYVSKDPRRPDAYWPLPSEEFYAYIGVWPFLLLAFLPLAFRRSNRRVIVFLGLLLLVMVAYVATRYMPWARLYVESSFWTQFRYQTRMLIYGAVALIALAGIGLDAVWRRVGTMLPLQQVSVPGVARWLASRVGAFALIAFMVGSVADVYSTNRAHVHSRTLYSLPYEVMGWLRQHDASTFYVSAPNGWHGAVISNGIRYLDGWYGLDALLPMSGAKNTRFVRARPYYAALGNDRVPDPPAELLQQFSQHSIWRLPDNLPFAFAVADTRLYDPAGGPELKAADVRALQPVLASPNRIAVQAEGIGGETLVVLTSAYRGWLLSVDGRSAPLRNVSGYLATALQPGMHRYEFSFEPLSFKLGLGLTTLTILGLVGLAVMDGRSKRPRFKTKAIYSGGALLPESPLDIPEDTSVRLIVEPLAPPASKRASPSSSEDAARAAPEAGVVSSGLARLGWILFGLGLFVYLFTRLWHIDQFPIFFFTDEATFALLAENLLARGLRDGSGTFLPIYFEVAGNRWTPVLAVYAHLPAVAMFGKSIIATRATAALVTLLSPLAVALTLKSVFRARFWWAGALLVAVVPTWFLHSRTAFEWLMMASCYAGFILSYLLYRTRSPRFLLLAILFGALTFYNHASGQLVMAVVTLLLLVSDLRYHLKNWRVMLLGLLLAALLAIPILRFQAQHPGAMFTHLRMVDSYWFRDVPLADKLRQFADTYLYGLSPAYWFIPNTHDLVRHRMLGYGNLGFVMLPFVVVGGLLCLWRVRSPVHRAVLLAALAAPAGAATADVAITRMMAFVPPACIIAGLGLDWLVESAHKAWCSLQKQYAERGADSSRFSVVLALVVFVALSGASLGMLRDALTKGPTWYTDYGLYGMQFGARELFAEAIPEYLAANPDATVVVSPNWANGTDTFVRFFVPREQQFTRVQMHDVRYFMTDRRPLSPDMTLVMTFDEYEQAQLSGKFKSFDVVQTIPYPDGRTGFYFVKLAYADNFDEILAREREERRRPVLEQIELGGQTVEVLHSQFDMGLLPNAFDGDLFSLVRGLEANPLVFEFTFPQPRELNGLTATFGSMDFTLKAILVADNAPEPVVYEQTYRGLPSDPTADINFDRGPALVSKLRLEVLQLNAGAETHIHVREIKFK